jgi:hypothetical protein
MKTSKSLMLAFATLLLSTSLFAGNPENLATKIVAKLSKDIVLTDSQKVVIQTKAKELALKRQNADALSDKTEKTELKRQASQSYKAIVDSLLTNEQRQQLKVKQNERRDAMIKKQSKNN